MAGAGAMETQGVKVMNFQKNIHYSCLIPSRDLQRVLQICKGIKEIPNELGSQNRGTIDIVYLHVKAIRNNVNAIRLRRNFGGK